VATICTLDAGYLRGRGCSLLASEPTSLAMHADSCRLQTAWPIFEPTHMRKHQLKGRMEEREENWACRKDTLRPPASRTPSQVYQPHCCPTCCMERSTEFPQSNVARDASDMLVSMLRSPRGRIRCTSASLRPLACGPPLPTERPRRAPYCMINTS
jgi:hypothetical protein